MSAFYLRASLRQVQQCTRTRVATGGRRSIVHSATASTPATSPFAPRHFLSIADLTSAELTSLVNGAARAKAALKSGTTPGNLLGALTGKTIAMMFNKRSTRTRVSTEAATVYLGGHPMFLGKDDIQLGVNESLHDTSKIISSMTSCMVVRCGPHSDITGLAKTSAVPVINALSDAFHPMQAIADMLTISEIHPMETFSKVKVAWVGDANNVLYDMAIACAKLGIHVSVATPKVYPMNPDMLELARSCGDETGSIIETTHSPEEAVKDADIIVTDTWVSMGQEDEKALRLKQFAGFQVTEELATKGGAKPDWKFMHCLPRKQEEVTDAVFYSPRSVVFEEGENRLYAAIASLEAFVVKKGKF